MNNIQTEKFILCGIIIAVGIAFGVYFKFEWSFYTALALLVVVIFLLDNPFKKNEIERADIKFVFYEILQTKTARELLGYVSEAVTFKMDSFTNLTATRDKNGGLLLTFDFKNKHHSWYVDDSTEFVQKEKNGWQINTRLWNINHPITNELSLSKISLTKGTKLNTEEAIETLAKVYGTERGKILAGINTAIGVANDEL